MTRSAADCRDATLARGDIGVVSERQPETAKLSILESLRWGQNVSSPVNITELRLRWPWAGDQSR